MRVSIFIFEIVIILFGAIRYLRIAQREHYLAFSVSKFAHRWYKIHLSYFLLTVTILIGLISIKFWYLSLIGVIALSLLPLGLTYRGSTSKLVYTRRLAMVLITLFGLYAILSAAVLVVVPIRVLGIVAVASGIFLPVLVDIALMIDSPIEELLWRKFLKQAKAKLDVIAPTVVGITGSYGKTSTKVLAHHFLCRIKETEMSPKSFNNKSGLTRTVLENLHGTSKILVAEMGTYGKGEIRRMVSWLKPKVAAMVSVGPVHLERMKTLNNILEAKAEIFEFAEYAVLNFDDELVASIEDRLTKQGIRVCKCSTDLSKVDLADVVLSVQAKEATLYLNHRQVLRFGYDLTKPPPINVAVALGICLYFDTPIDAIKQVIECLPEVDHRATVTAATTGVIIVDDTFNSNPAGAKLALARSLEQLTPGASLYVVTPGMVEMGKLQFEANRVFAEQILNAGAKLLAVKNTNKKALLSQGGDTMWFKDRNSASQWIKDNCKPSDVVLFENDLPDHFP